MQISGDGERSEQPLPAGLSAGTLQGLDHVGIVVRSTTAAVSTFTTLLGLQLVHDETLSHLSVRLSYLGTDIKSGLGPFLQLVEPMGPGPILDYLEGHGEGLHHVCFVVHDVGASVVAAGGTAAAVFPGGRARRCAFLTQLPHGLVIELTESRPWPGSNTTEARLDAGDL